jgi:multidrug resistance efflux pump
MTIGLLITIIYVTIFWLVFFKFKLIKFSIGWGVVSSFVGLHVLLIFMIGLRFMVPLSTNATVVQHTIQLIPRLPDPTLVTGVLVKEDVPVKKGDPLFQFDRRPYEYKIEQLEAQLAEARQNVLVLKANVDLATQNVAKLKSELDYELFQKGIFDRLAKQGAVREDDIEKWQSRVTTAQAAVNQAIAALEVARLNYEAQIGGTNTAVANVEAQLRQARYYLEHTTMTAPEDGRIINLQVRPGMVSGIYRIGGIAAFLAEADRYLLATFYQENLKYVRPGQSVEVSLDLYPGQIFPGSVDSVWKGSGVGQYLPSDELPKFQQPAPGVGQGQYAVKILLDDADQSKFPIGAQGAAAIYTTGGAWAALRKISIRAHSWANFLYPLNF